MRGSCFLRTTGRSYYLLVLLTLRPFGSWLSAHASITNKTSSFGTAIVLLLEQQQSTTKVVKHCNTFGREVPVYLKPVVTAVNT